MGTLVIVRHGESRWNLCNRFTGWVDVPLSKKGITEADQCAKHCSSFDFDAAFTSDLERSQETLLIILSRQNRTAVIQHGADARYRHWVRKSNKCTVGDIPVYCSAFLNERYYGDLQGMDKEEADRRYGPEKVQQWRRGYDDRPPNGETLRETYVRMRPYFTRYIARRVQRGESILLVGHGNTLRALIKYLEHVRERDMMFIDLPEAHPIVYTYQRSRFTRVEGEYTFNRPLR